MYAACSINFMDIYLIGRNRGRLACSLSSIEVLEQEAEGSK
jgi:hypothetical protein